MAGKPSAKTEVMARLKKVEQYLSLQMTTSEIVRRLSEDEGVSRRQAERYIATAFENWEFEARKERPALKQRMRASLRKLYQQALSEKDRKAAVAALRELCKIDGLYAPTEAMVTVSGAIEARVAAMTTGDRRARIAELLAKGGGGGDPVDTKSGDDDSH